MWRPHQDAKALKRPQRSKNDKGHRNDPEKPFVTSGIRVGTPAGTTRGFGEAEFRQVADWIADVVEAQSSDGAEAVEARVRDEVKTLTASFPIYPDVGA